MVVLLLLPADSRYKHGSVNVHNIFAYLALSLNAPQVYVIQERYWFSKINFFIEWFPHQITIFVSFQAFWCHPHTQIRIILFHDVQRDIPNLEFSPIHVSTGVSQIAFPYNSLAKRWPYRFLSRRTTRSSILDHDFGHLCRGRRIQMSGHSDLGILNNLWASSIFTWV